MQQIIVLLFKGYIVENRLTAILMGRWIYWGYE